MIKIANITPGYSQNALISVNALVDIDIGLYNLIKEQYLDPSVFNEELLKSISIIDMINMTYFRKEDNPLYDISCIDNKKELDDYYMQFMENQYKEIFDRSIYTDVLKLIDLLLESNEVKITILYYSDYAKEQMEKDQELGKLNKSIQFISIKELPKKVNTFNEIYLRSIYEFENLKDEYFTSPKVFYISTFGKNYDSLGRLIKLPSIDKIMTSKLMHEIFTFSLYNTGTIHKDIIEGDSNKDGKD